MSIPKSFLLDIGGKELLRFEAISIGRNVWCEFAVVKLIIKLIIKYDMASWGNAFDVEYDDNVSISTLKDKVKEMMKPDLNNFAANSFSARIVA